MKKEEYINELIERLKVIRKEISRSGNNKNTYHLMKNYNDLSASLAELGFVPEQCEINDLYDDDRMEKFNRLFQKEYLNYINFFNLNIEDLIFWLKKITKIYQKYPLEPISFSTKVNNKVDGREVVKGFFQSVGGEFERFTQKLDDESHIFVSKTINEAYSGLCVNLADTGEGHDSLIYLQKNFHNDYNYMASVVHEIGHSYEYMLNKTNTKLIKISPFSEVPSLFFEKLFRDYLIGQDYFKNMGQLLEIRQNNLNYDFTVVNSAVDKLVHNVYTGFDGNKKLKVTSDDLLNYLNDEELFVCSFYGINTDCYIYTIGDLIANYFAKLYRQDKKEALLLLKNFCLGALSENNVNDVLEKYNGLEGMESSVKRSYEFQKRMNIY